MRFSKILYFCATLFLAAGCSKKIEPPNPPKPLVLVSIAPYQLLAKKIAGESFAVQAVVPSASNPHSFEPTSAQITALGDAQIWFRIGEPFENKILPALQANNLTLTVADLRDGIEMIEEPLSCSSCCMDHRDRHIWLSPKLAAQQAELIKTTLSEKYPDQANEFQKNYLDLCEELTLLEKEIRETLKGVEKRTLLVSHPAFGYFCKDFDFVQLSVEYEGKDPRPRHLEEILNRAIAESAELALALPQYNNKGAQIIAEKIHKPVRYIDPYSADYFDTMRKLAKLIADPYAN